MKSHKEILYEELSDNDIMRLNSSMKQNIFDTMNIAARQAFEAGQEYTSVNPTTITQGFNFDYETFEDYLKELKDEL